VAFLPIAPVGGDDNEAEEFRALFKHYSVPSTVPAERMRNFGFSFGTFSNRSDKSEAAWFHFLCRRVEILGGIIQGLGYLRHGELGSKADPSKMWTMCDFYLHVKHGLETNGEREIVTLLCFGAPGTIMERFNYLHHQTAWRDVLTEPYILFDILFDELHGMSDNIAWELSKAVNPEEKLTLARGAENGKHWSDFNYQNMHNIQKYRKCYEKHRLRYCADHRLGTEFS
jgi:hypothetical protein